MVVILLDGLQGVGKTSLMNWLEHAGHLTNMRLPRPQSVAADTYIGINQYTTNAAKKVIIERAKDDTVFAVDRYIASEYAFGHVCDRQQGYAWLMDIDRELSKHNVISVYIIADRTFCINNIWARRGPYTAELMIAQLDKAEKYFEEYYAKSKIRSIRYHNKHAVGLSHSAAILWGHICEDIEAHK